ncbi:MAG: hypothetical protein OEX10_04525 [Candidatus Bathyarchaeota archaeon]|nr:hypothetical protein [Candidatus Bathyarchaeota archaeon]MDH5663400.1 hypothetical protein [Candidatus Bathyarchaeota archaeon]
MTKLKGRKTISSVYLALIAVWTALLLACAFLIIYPIPGTPASITFSSVLLSSLTAPLLGPLYGTTAGFIFGWLVPYVNPATSIGILTFLTPTLAALMSGLVLFNRWKEATLIFLCQIAIWLAHPFAWYQLMPLVTWQYWIVLAFIVVPPIRKWIIHSIVSRDQKHLPIALWCLAWIARIGGDVATGNNIAVWILNWTGPDFYPFWAPMTLYYAVADSLNCLVGAIIGTGVLTALKRSGIRITALDVLQSKLTAK